MTEQLFALFLDDAAIPAICSGDQLYVGCREHLEEIAARMEEEGVYLETAAAIKAYFAGDKQAAHNIAYRQLPVLTPVQLVHCTIFEIGEHEWEHENAWGCPYKLKCSGGVVQQLVVKCNRQHWRCVKATLQNLQMTDTWNCWIDVRSIWGHRFLMEFKNEGIRALGQLLFKAEKGTGSAEELTATIKDEKQISFKGYCNEIFSDG